MAPEERRLVIVVRADPVICGHSGEARNLAEAAILRGYSEVRILSWPIERIEACGLPTKPIESILPYSPGIVVERPPPIGDYRVPDGRYSCALKGRLVELITDSIDTVIVSLYLMPHTCVVAEAMAAALGAGLPIRAQTVAEAVGSDITNVVSSCVSERRFGPATYLFSTYLSQDVCVAVSRYTKEQIVEAARHVDAACGTEFARACDERVELSYPAIDASSFIGMKLVEAEQVWRDRQLERDGYVLFLSRVVAAKGVDDLILAYRHSECYGRLPLVIAGNGPALPAVRELVGQDPWIRILTDVSDAEKRGLMFGSAAYVLPSKPRPEFIETFGIALVEKMLVGGRGPVITTTTGGIPEAVGDCALTIEAGSIESIRQVLDHAVYGMSQIEKQSLSARARAFALGFDRLNVFDSLMDRLPRPLAPSNVQIAAG